MHKMPATVRPKFLLSNHRESGTKSIARSAAIASGIRNSLAKYKPLITRNAKNKTAMLFESEWEVEIMSFRFQVNLRINISCCLEIYMM